MLEIVENIFYQYCNIETNKIDKEAYESFSNDSHLPSYNKEFSFDKSPKSDSKDALSLKGFISLMTELANQDADTFRFALEHLGYLYEYNLHPHSKEQRRCVLTLH